MPNEQFIPSEFYFSQKELSLSYSDSPPGQFDLNRFLNSEPYWELEQQNIEILQPKILILNDTHIPTLDTLTCLTLLEYYLFLIHHGFSIYTYDAYELILLNEHNIHMLLQHQDISFSDLTETELLALIEKKLNTNREKIHILNNDTTKNILFKMQVIKTDTSKKIFVDTEIHPNDLYDLKPDINTLELDCITLTSKFDSKKKLNLSHILNLTIKNPKITQHELLTIINACENLKILFISMDSSDIKFHNFYKKIKPKHISILKLYGCQGDSDNIFNFINQLESIRDIEWCLNENETEFINNKTLLTPPTLKNFTYIIDEVPDCEDEILCQFEMPHLNLYNLNIVNIDAACDITSQMQFYYKQKRTLVKFKTQGSVSYALDEKPLTESLQIQHEFFSQAIQLLSNFPDITSLYLDHIYPDETPEFKSLNLKHLKHLYISNTALSTDALNCIIGQSRNVKIHYKNNTTKMKEKLIYIDANTEHNANRIINIEKIFFVANPAYEINSHFYRSNIAEKSACNPSYCDINSAFILKEYDNLELTPTSIIRSSVDLYQKMIALNDNDIAYGKQTLTLSPNVWHPIASSSPHDEMLEFHTMPNDLNIEIHYSNAENRYYIKWCENLPASRSIELKFDFIIKRHINRQIHLVNNFYSQNFKRESLSLNPGKRYTGLDYLKEIANQQTGACRHRTVLYNQQNPNSTRIITNASHAFIEVRHNGVWATLDLDGYPVKLNINSIKPNTDQAKIDGYTNALQEMSKHSDEVKFNIFDFKKVLIECDNIQDALSCCLFLEKDCIENKRPVFYVSKPSDLNCRAPWMKNNHGIGELHTEPGGLLFDFIHATHTTSPVIIMNLENFKLNEIVKFNTMFDRKRKIDGFNIPENFIIIALNNLSSTECYRSVDFTSRFDMTLQNPFKNRPDNEFNIPITPQNPSHRYFTINLFNNHKWKNELLGHWVVNGRSFHHKPGKLIEAIESGLPIEIQNGLCEDNEFNFFIKQAFLRGYIIHNGEKININKKASLTFSSNHKEYPFAEVHGFSPCAPILNRTQFPLFFEQNEFDLLNRLIVTKPGIIELHQNSTLKVNYTHPISHDLLNKLHAECEKYNVTLEYYLPDYHNYELATKKSPQSTVVIDISEYKATELLSKISMKINATTNHLEFEQAEKFLLTSKNKNIEIILKGTFSQELSEALAPFLLDYIANPKPYTILIITDDATHLSYLHKDMLLVIPRNNSLPSELLSLPPVISTLNASDLILHRKKLIDNALKKFPIVFIAGVTGTGKTHFIQHEYLKSKTNHRLFIGDSKILEWAKDRTLSGQKILFIDEGNIDKRDWNEFEGLFHNSPYMIIEGDYHELDSNHKIIFAGNPANYGDRNIPQLFINHPNIIVFDILSIDFIREKIIKPILPWDMIAKPILDVYATICQHTVNEVLISPRELQTMAKLVMSAYRADPHINLLEASRYYAHLIGNQIIPDLFENNHQFKSPHLTQIKNYNYLLTQSRLPLWQLISDLLAQRIHPGGLGGIIIEGESGIGKSELVFEILLSKQQSENLLFYHLPVSMDYDQKILLLLKAFHEGAVVIIDEINASPMMERLLNNLLMGQTHEGEKAKQPGFMIIGTQNPAYYAGRFNQSTALSRRLSKVKLEPYSQNEIEVILEYKNIDPKNAKLIAAAYKQAKPTPTLRDVFKLTEQLHIPKKRKADYNSWMLLFNLLQVDPNDVKQPKYSHINKNGP